MLLLWWLCIGRHAVGRIASPQQHMHRAVAVAVATAADQSRRLRRLLWLKHAF